MDPDNRDFLKQVRDAEAALEALLALLATQLVRIVIDKSRRGRTSQQQLIDRVIKQYIDSYRLVVTDAVANTAGIQADRNAAKLLPLLGRDGASNEQDFMDERFKGYRDDVRRRFPTLRHPEDLKTFEQRVVNVRRGFARTVYQLVQEGVDRGVDPRKVAALIEDAVVMTPPKTNREAANLRRQAGVIGGRGVPSGSIQYNSMRIARTEMAGIYRRSVTDFFDDRPYNEGYDWVLSNRHKGPDRCDRNAQGSPYMSQAEVPSTHPLCLCRLVARIMSQAKLKQLIASGALD